MIYTDTKIPKPHYKVTHTLTKAMRPHDKMPQTLTKTIYPPAKMRHTHVLITHTHKRAAQALNNTIQIKNLTNKL